MSQTPSGKMRRRDKLYLAPRISVHPWPCIVENTQHVRHFRLSLDPRLGGQLLRCPMAQAGCCISQSTTAFGKDSVEIPRVPPSKKCLTVAMLVRGHSDLELLALLRRSWQPLFRKIRESNKSDMAEFDVPGMTREYDEPSGSRAGHVFE